MSESKSLDRCVPLVVFNVGRDHGWFELDLLWWSLQLPQSTEFSSNMSHCIAIGYNTTLAYLDASRFTRVWTLASTGDSVGNLRGERDKNTHGTSGTLALPTP